MPEEKTSCGAPPTCPITHLLRIVAAKWSFDILRELALGPRRTLQLLTMIPGCSMKSLQDRLKALDSAGMITVTRSATTTPRTELEITNRGRKLLSILLDLKALSFEGGSAECQCPFEGGEPTDCPIRNRESGQPGACPGE